MPASAFKFLRHLWLDASDAERKVGKAVLERIAQRVAASEQRHSGEIRFCIEASLPLSYLWRVSRERPLTAVIRERAVMMFSKLGVWDTEANNGVLIYVLLAEHAIEIVADRGLNGVISSERWAQVVGHLGQAFKDGRHEDGLTQALEEISALLMEHFAVSPGSTSPNPNELPDTPAVL
ncbi:MAG: TPM domain-containing protein [Pseudomonadota bacterium]